MFCIYRFSIGDTAIQSVPAESRFSYVIGLVEGVWRFHTTLLAYMGTFKGVTDIAVTFADRATGTVVFVGRYGSDGATHAMPLTWAETSPLFTADTTGKVQRRVVAAALLHHSLLFLPLSQCSLPTGSTACTSSRTTTTHRTGRTRRPGTSSSRSAASSPLCSLCWCLPPQGSHTTPASARRMRSRLRRCTRRTTWLSATCATNCGTRCTCSTHGSVCLY